MYESFQRIAVAIDHGIAYSKLHNDVTVGSEPWELVLNRASYQLRLVLTEIQTSLMEMNVTVEKNIDKDIIPDNLYICENTDVGIFNAIVYRQYFHYLTSFHGMLIRVVKRLKNLL